MKPLEVLQSKGRATPRKSVSWFQRREGVRQFVTFTIVGAVNTVFYVAMFNLLRFAGLGPFVANGIAVMISISFSFWANSKFTFRAESTGSARRYVEFAGVFLSTLVFSNLALWALFELVGEPTPIQESVVLVASGAALFVVRFAAMRAWVFNPDRGS